VSGRPVSYAEMPGAHHDFDLYESIRSAAVNKAVEQFAARVSAFSDANHQDWQRAAGRRDRASLATTVTAANNRQQPLVLSPSSTRTARRGLWTGQAPIAGRRLVPVAPVNRRYGRQARCLGRHSGRAETSDL